MKTKFSLLVMLFTLQNTFAQIIFEKGYFINTKNKKIECLIKNYDWKNNPRSIEYKINEDTIVEKASIDTVKEFGINGVSKFVRADVNIDRSLDEVDRLSTQRNPEWNQEQLFLEVLVEGKASLYYYEDGNLNRFFYSIDDSIPQQLIYKRFIYKESMIGVNDGYRQQLWSNLNSGNITMDYIKSINYKKSQLKDFFKKYNYSIEGHKELVSELRNNQFSLHIGLTTGLITTTLSILNVDSKAGIHFNRNLSFSFGLNGEIILPYNKNKWAIIFNPTYQYFNATIKQYQIYNTLTGQLFLRSASVNYSSIEFPIGVRHYMFLKKDIKTFLNLFYIPAYTILLNKDLNIENNILNMKTGDSYAIGGGISNKKLSAEIRYYTNRSIATEYIYWQTNYTRIALILGIKFH